MEKKDFAWGMGGWKSTAYGEVVELGMFHHRRMEMQLDDPHAPNRATRTFTKQLCDRRPLFNFSSEANGSGTNLQGTIPKGETLSVWKRFNRK